MAVFSPCFYSLAGSQRRPVHRDDHLRPRCPRSYDNAPEPFPARDPSVRDSVEAVARRHGIICRIDPFDVNRYISFGLMGHGHYMGSRQEYEHMAAALWRREQMVRIVERLVREHGLPRPQSRAPMDWKPTLSCYDPVFMPERLRAIDDEMSKHSSKFPWVDEAGLLGHRFRRPNMYLVNALELSTLSMDEIVAWIKTISASYTSVSTETG